MNKDIEEMARVICDFTHSKNKCDCINTFKNEENQCSAYCDCKRLYNAGYRKIVWHKVSDGDLPKERGDYYCYCPTEFYEDMEYLVLYYDIERHNFHSADDWYNHWDVAAWTELPEYEEE